MGGIEPGPAHFGVPREKVRSPAPVGISRSRLTTRILGPAAGVRLVVGPAGSGKTTALAHAAQAFTGRCVWLSLDGTDRHPSSFSRSLTAATGLGQVGDVLSVVAALDDGDPTLVVLDDVHEVAGSPAGDAIDLLCRYRPRQVTVALGTRALQRLNHWRWGIDAASGLLDVDDLRFRLWEVDELFRHLEAPLAPADVHALARRTDGWAVALRLFHIVLRDAPSDASTLLARSPRFTHRSIRGYVRDEVLARVTDEQRAFLARSAILDRLRPAQCDELLERGGSGGMLEELASCGLLVPDIDGSSYRLHEVLRDHLLGELAADIGDDAVAVLHRRAAGLLERQGHVADAIRSSARAGDWDTLRRLVRDHSERAATALHGVPRIPGDVRAQDPWVLRAEAQRQLGEADLRGAQHTLRAAAERFAETGGDAGTDALLRAVNAWVKPSPGPARSWVAALRRSLSGVEVASWGTDQGGRFARGVAALVAGQLDQAVPSLLEARRGPHTVIAAMAATGLALAARLAGGDDDGALDTATVMARAAEAPAVVVAAEVVASGTPLASDGGEDDDLVAAFEGFCLSLLSLSSDAPAPGDVAGLEAVLSRQALLAPLAVVRAAELVRRVKRGGPVDPRAGREPRVRAAGPLAQALTLLAVGLGQHDAAATDAARRLAGTSGFGRWLEAVGGTAALPVGTDPGPPAGPGSPTAAEERAAAGPADLAVEVMGEFRLSRRGDVLDLSALRPRHLELLQLLAVNANRWMHRETLWELLWSDRPPEAASHNLHVAVSAVRRAIDPEATRGQSSILTRSGNRYRLEVRPQDCDLCRFEHHLHQAGGARRAGDLERALRELSAAVLEWRGEPVPAAGPADWAVARRDELRRRFAHVAGDVLAALEPTVESSALAARAVAIEPSDDLLWRHAIDHARRVGAVARLKDLETAYVPGR